MLREAGIEANAHSNKSASTSVVFTAGLSVKEIIDTACRSKESTFKDTTADLSLILILSVTSSYKVRVRLNALNIHCHVCSTTTR